MKRRIAIIGLVLAISSRLFSQSYADQRSGVFLMNTVSNALIGGLGGLIHKKEGQKAYKVFISNFLKGGLGGLVKYTAKYQVYYQLSEGTAFYAPINRFCFFVGHSMVQNASYNRPLLETVNVNLYGFDIRYTGTAQKKFNTRLSLATLISAGSFGARGYRLDLYHSLEYGVLFFSMSRRQSNYGGFAGFNCMTVLDINGRPYRDAVPHEIVHTYQAYDYFGLSALYDAPLKKRLQKNKIYNILNRYVVADYETLFFSAFYRVQPQPRYYRNYFEYEATHFATRTYIKR